MRRIYRWGDILVMPEALIAFAWSAPMRDLAPKLGMSDVGLRKLLASHDVPPPPQGYWNKLRAGKPVQDRPKAPERRPGEIGRVRVDNRFAELIPVAEPIPSTGPFATRHVPEDLDELRQRALKAIGRATVPRSLESPHRGLVDLLRKEQRRREKAAADRWHWDNPRFDTPLAQRRLRIFNAIFLAISKPGGDGSVHEDNGELRASASVGDTWLRLELVILGKHRTTMQYGYHRPAPDLPANTPLVLRIDPGRDGASDRTYQDGADKKIESRIAEIAADLVLLGEAKFRRGLRKAEEAVVRQQEADRQRRLERLAAANAARLQALHKSGELLLQANTIRRVVKDIEQAVGDGLDVDPEALLKWREWALAEADKIDPVQSGQVFAHLTEPQLE